VAYHDTHVKTLKHDHGELVVPQASIDRAGDFDCVVITTDHSDVDYKKLVETAKLVVDTRNATKAFRREYKDKIVSL